VHNTIQKYKNTHIHRISSHAGNEHNQRLYSYRTLFISYRAYTAAILNWVRKSIYLITCITVPQKHEVKNRTWINSIDIHSRQVPQDGELDKLTSITYVYSASSSSSSGSRLSYFCAANRRSIALESFTPYVLPVCSLVDSIGRRPVAYTETMISGQYHDISQIFMQCIHLRYLQPNHTRPMTLPSTSAPK